MTRLVQQRAARCRGIDRTAIRTWLRPSADSWFNKPIRQADHGCMVPEPDHRSGWKARRTSPEKESSHEHSFVRHPSLRGGLGLGTARSRLPGQSAHPRAGDLRPHVGNGPAGASAAGLTDVTCYDNIQRAVAHPGVDIVSICTPQHLHCQHAVAAADAGKHILLEKPAGISLEQINTLSDLLLGAGPARQAGG